MFVKFFCKINSRIAFQFIYSCTVSCTFLVNCLFLINFRSQDTLNTQSLAKAVSKDGVLFVGLVGNSALGCLNEHQPLQRENLVSSFLLFLFFFTFFCYIFLVHFFLSDAIITIIKSEFSHEKYTSTVDLTETGIT